MTNIIDFPQQEKIEEEASAWIIRFDGLDNPSPQDIAELKQWMQTSPAHHDAIIRLAGLWENMTVLSLLQVPEIHAARRKPGLLTRLSKSWQGINTLPVR